ncbi:MAG TPA: HD domain-containing phosphohydrolase [Blastocatellia bacterium]|nr:HD domain-containing phosphohydrolase [Blastocatellia bacterium]
METAKRKTGEEAITTTADRIDSFKKYSSPHSRLMARLAAHLARRFGLTQPDIHAIAEAAYLHDIGLRTMNPPYQLTPGPLSFEERMDLWRHPIIGEQQMAKRDCLRHSQLLVRWHHEWWNGGGYPDQLSFEDIPIGARILRAVELYSALIADRPYRAALSHEQAIDTLKASAGIECDPFVVKALVALIEDVSAHAKQSESQPAPEPSPSREASAPERGVETSPLEAPSPARESWPNAEGATVPSGDGTAFAVSDAPGEPRESAPHDSTSEARDAASGEHAPELIAQPAAGESVWGALRVDATAPADESAQAKGQDAREPSAATSVPQVERQAERQAEQQGDAPRPSPPADESLKLSAQLEEFREEQPRILSGWGSSRYNKKTLLGFEASVLRQIEFRSIAIPFCGWARLDLYLKMWGKHILANDPRAWAAAVARATVEAKASLGEDHVVRVLEDVYVPGSKLTNPGLRRWFSETDAWWMDNLRRNVEALDDESLRAQAMMLGLMTGDYARSFDDETRELRRPLTTVFWRLAGRAFFGAAGHPHNRSYNLPAEEFIKHARADLLYLNLPAVHAAQAGAEARAEWRESWIRGAAGVEADDGMKLATAPQSKTAYLALIEKLLRAASNIKIWAIEYQEIGLAAAAELAELIKAYRPVRATYSKDLTEVVGGLRNYIIVAEKGSAS